MSRFLWVLLFIFTSLITQAQSYKGGTVQIVPAGNRKVEIRVTALRNCVTCDETRVCDLPEYATVKIENDSLHVVSLKLESAVADGFNEWNTIKCNKCLDDSCQDHFAYMIYNFTGILNLDDLQDNPSCIYTVEVKMGRMDEAFTTIEKSNASVVIRTKFNGCSNNSTPHTSYFGEVFNRYKTINTTFDSDVIGGERIVYSLVRPKLDSGRLIYVQDLDFDKPIKFLGFPDVDREFPYGFHFDTTSAQVRFKSFYKDYSLMRIRMEEYRKDELVSVSYKDVFFDLENWSQNKTPILSGLKCTHYNNYTKKANLSVEKDNCFTLCTSDEDKRDSTFIEVLNPALGMTTKIISGTDRRQRIELCWSPTLEDMKNNPYILQVKVSDSNPTPRDSIFTYQLHISKSPEFAYTLTKSGCGKLAINLKYTGEIAIKNWIIKLNNKSYNFLDSSWKTERFQLDSGMNYLELKGFSKSGIFTMHRDSIYSTFSSPFTNDHIEIPQCIDREVQVDLRSVLQKNTSFHWLSDQSRDTIKTFLETEKNTTYQVIGTNNHCTDTLDVRIKVLTFDPLFTLNRTEGRPPLELIINYEKGIDADSFHIEFDEEDFGRFTLEDFPIHYTYGSGQYNLKIYGYNRQKSCREQMIFKQLIDVWPTSINEHHQEASQVSMYPNPASTVLHIDSDHELDIIKIYDNYGRFVLKKKGSSTSFSIADLTEGVYYVALRGADVSTLKKLVILR